MVRVMDYLISVRVDPRTLTRIHPLTPGSSPRSQPLGVSRDRDVPEFGTGSGRREIVDPGPVGAPL